MYVHQIVSGATTTTRAAAPQSTGALERIYQIAEGEARRIKALEGEEVLHELIVDVFSAVEAVGKMLKGDLTSGFLALAALVTKYKDYKPILEDIIEQFKDLDAGEARDLFNTLAEELDLEDNDLEQRIEDVIEIPVNVYEKVGAIVVLYDEINDILRDDDLDGWDKLEKITDLNVQIISLVRDIIKLVKESVDAVKALTSKPEDGK